MDDATVMEDEVSREREREGVEISVHDNIEAFAEATGLSVEMIRAHGIIRYNSATGVPLHIFQKKEA